MENNLLYNWINIQKDTLKKANALLAHAYQLSNTESSQIDTLSLEVISSNLVMHIEQIIQYDKCINSLLQGQLKAQSNNHLTDNLNGQSNNTPLETCLEAYSQQYSLISKEISVLLNKYGNFCTLLQTITQDLFVRLAHAEHFICQLTSEYAVI